MSKQTKVPIEQKKDRLILPVVSHGAEFLVQGYLMRRNILTYKAPPNNEGYDLICIHPDPRKKSKQIRIQVKSRYAADCDKGFPVKEKSCNAFDYLIIVFLNIGLFYKKNAKPKEGFREVEFYTLPRSFIKKHHKSGGTFGGKLILKGLESKIEKYKNEKGFELIAEDLKVSYPNRSRNNAEITSR